MKSVALVAALVVGSLVVGSLVPAPPVRPGQELAADQDAEVRAALATDIANPERGLYSSIDIVGATDLHRVRDQGYTLAHAYVRLDDYRNSELPAELLSDLSTGFDAARTAGIKVIFRASYNFGIGDEDAPKERVLQHIGQLQPLFEQHEDVIAVIQAGFIGAWGEWHSSTNGLTDPAIKREIRNALLAAVPDSRMVQFRYLPDIENWLPAPLDPTAAYSATPDARTAHHNDCFLANDHDAGTYSPGSIPDHKQYLATMSQFVAVGGETCEVGFSSNLERRSCAVAIEELARFHWTYLNAGWHEPTLQIWQDQGCWDEISQRLGYRYWLDTMQLPVQVVAGTSLTGEIAIGNDGFASLFNPRPAYLVLDGPTRVELRLNTDPRRWTAGAITRVSLNELVPSSLSAGNYTVALWLPDAAESLRNRPDYAVKLANEGVWNPAAGYNVLGGVTILPAETCTGGVGSRFADVDAGNVFCGDIDWLAETGITKGCNPPTNDLFCPNDTVTRGQMAAFLHRALGDNIPTPATTTFTDTIGNIFEADINWLAATGVTKGCNPPTNDLYCPDRPVTRGQMAAFLHRALGNTIAPGTPAMLTDTAGNVFEADIEWLAATGITRGCNPPTNNRFCPNQPVTRGQMAAFLNRALN